MNLFKKIIYEIINFFRNIIYGFLHLPKINPYSLEEKEYFIFTYKFPDNTIYVGKTYSIDCLDFLHFSFGRGNYFEPICVARKKYPDVYPRIEIHLKGKRTVEELNLAKRKVLGFYPNMRVLNRNLKLD